MPNNSWELQKEAALAAASWRNISWLKILQHLPCRVYSSPLYPYSHRTEAKLIFIETIQFHYLSGSTLHRRKGHQEELQEREELLIFADKYTGQKCATVKNVRSYLAQAFRPVPLNEAERMGVFEHDLVFAQERDWRPAVENLGKRKWRYIHYD
jgi:hypothetical protein